MRLLVQLCRDAVRPTYTSTGGAARLDGGLTVSVGRPAGTVPDEVSGHHLDHRFDLLGSGWLQIEHGMACRGVLGHRYRTPVEAGGGRVPDRPRRCNRREAARVRGLVDADYVPIDWHLDFKSGWRWLPTTWYRRVRTAPAPGVDIKVPWELARMQHLPQLALTYQSPDSVWYRDRRIPIEFRNQVLDFIASNPPRYGVNWKCTMEVGIRAANWVLAHGLLTAAGARFDGTFQAVFTRSLREHALHIVSNLEKIDGRRANHYLGNLAGLVFCAAYLPPGDETEAWLAFGRQQLVEEMEYQFLPDGGHFEGSAAYHCFALELMVYPAAVIRGLGPGRRGSLDGDPDFPDWWWSRLARAYRFLRAMQGPGGQLTQVGDNDSGRLFRLCPRYVPLGVAEARRRYANLEGYRDLEDDAVYWMEDLLDVRGTVAATGALLGLEHEAQARDAVEAKVIRALRPGASRPPAAADQLSGMGQAVRAAERGSKASSIGDTLKELGPPVRRQFSAVGGDLTEGLVLSCFPDFGSYVFSSPRLYLLVRAWVRPPVYTAHLHDDQLGITLWMDGEPLIRDPGSFLYTPAPAERSRYRGVAAHDTPRPLASVEPAVPGHDVFVDPAATPCTQVEIRPYGFWGRHEETARRVSILPDRVVIEDWPGRAGTDRRAPLFSPGYGVQERPLP